MTDGRKDGQTNTQTDESDFIGGYPNNVDRPTSFDTNKVREILYCDFKKFNSEFFYKHEQNVLFTKTIITCKEFEDTFLNILNIHVPLKEKLLKAKYSRYMTKALRKAIMRTFKLETMYYRKQINKSFKKAEKLLQ